MSAATKKYTVRVKETWTFWLLASGRSGSRRPTGGRGDEEMAQMEADSQLNGLIRIVKTRKQPFSPKMACRSNGPRRHSN